MNDPFDEFRSRVIELEIRSEERRAEVERLDEFVRGFDGRIRRLEAEILNLRKLLEDPPGASPEASDEKPPHY